MGRIDHFDDPNAPPANSLVPAASAVVPNDQSQLLLQRRSDNGLWALPGGRMELGETIRDTVVREVQEETGLAVEPEYLIGIYTDPRHLVEFSDGEVRQQFSVCFACRIVGGALRPSSESSAVRFFDCEDLESLNIPPSHRLRIGHYLERRSQPVIE